MASNDRLTHYEIHARRGKDAMNGADILPASTGVAVHDHWKTYFGYEQCAHALCNAHPLRELQYIEKPYKPVWAADMTTLLREIKKAVDQARLDADSLPLVRIVAFEQRYDATLNAGDEANPRPPPKAPKKKGRSKQTPPLNLLDRFGDFKPQVLAFLYDFRVPFDNNQAEREVRMMKVKQKVSGSFRTVEGAERFALLRG